MIPGTPLRFVFHFIFKQRTRFLLCLLTGIIWALNDAFFPYLLKRLIHIISVTKADYFSASAGILVIICCSWIGMDIFQRVGGFIQMLAIPQFRAQIRLTIFNYARSHSLEYFSENFAGSLARKIADLPSSCQTLMEIILSQFVPAFVFASIVLVMMYFTSVWFGALITIWLILHFGICIFSMKYNNLLYKSQSEAASTLSGKVVDVFTNILTVRLFAHGNYELNYLKSFQEDEIKKSRKAMLWMELSRVGLGLSGLCLILGTVFLSLYALEKHVIQLADFTQIFMQTTFLLGWMWFMGFQLGFFSRESGQILDALSILRQPHDLVDSPSATSLKILQGDIQFSNISFSYPKGQKVFENLSVSIPAGQKVGLVGFSGSGKSTFVNLILRFYDITSGKILIDGQNIAEVTQESLRSQVSMIPQDPSLFHRSLKENIGYGRLDATEAEIMEASKLAHCDEFISTLKEGYESLVGERGIKLSGGQRQRISIARAILKNSPILIMDEATSALDSVTENLIQDSLKKLMENRTTIVVAHRLSTLSHMDRILVFDKGMLVEDGKPQDLLNQDGHFSKLWRMQKEGFLPE